MWVVLFDVNVLVVLVWDLYIYYVWICEWFIVNVMFGWVICLFIEVGFVWVLMNLKVFFSVIGIVDV